MNNRKLKHKNRQGFTLVELLVVIAILAVLASVSVVGYLGFVKKARVSNDTGIVTQMNTTLQANEVVDGKNTTAYDAFNEIDDAGLDVNKLSPTTEGYYYAFDISQNRVFLLDEKYNQVAPENYTMSDRINVFVIAGSDSEVSTLNTEGFSSYLKNTFIWSESNTDKKLAVNTGLDVGSVEVKEINYTSTKAQNVTLRTSGGKLTINDTNDASHQYHYGYADKVEIATGSNCYEGHALVGEMTITEGKVVAAKDAYIGLVKANPEEGKSVSLEEKDEGTFVIPSNADTTNIDPDVVKDIGYTNTGTTEKPTYAAASEDKEDKSYYKITDEQSLKDFRDTYNSGSRIDKIKLMNDITLTDEWTPIDGLNSDGFRGVFDGNNKTIYNLTINRAEDRSGLFGSLKSGATVKNVKLANVQIKSTKSYVGGIAGTVNYGAFIENCVIDSTSYIEGVDNVGGIVGSFAAAYGLRTSTITNCINYGTIKITNGSGTQHVGGIVGMITTSGQNVKFENCKNYGTIDANKGHAGGILGLAEQDTKIEFNNCSNEVSLDNFINAEYKGTLIGWMASNAASKIIYINNCTISQDTIGAVTKGYKYILVVDNVEKTVDASNATSEKYAKFSDYWWGKEAN